MLQLDSLLQAESEYFPANQADRIADRAAGWFLSSGIQEATGGVARYYRSDTRTNARISTEITGYAVSTFVYLHARLGDRAYLDAAIRAARFLTRTAWRKDLSAFPFEYPATGGAPQELTYFFDCGIIVRGLLDLWRVTNDVECLDGALRASQSMASDFRNGSGFHPILTLPDKSPAPHTPQWSRSPGCYQLKSALGWHDLYEATGDGQALANYECVLRCALNECDGFLPAENPEKTMDRLHAYCYFLEGILPAADRPECRAALEQGIERVSGYLTSIAPIFERSDVYAQLLRIRLLGHEFAGLPLDEREAAEEAAQIPGFQLDGADPAVRGGFGFGRRNGEMLPFANPVSTAFCLQALDMWSDFRSGKSLSRDALI